MLPTPHPTSNPHAESWEQGRVLLDEALAGMQFGPLAPRDHLRGSNHRGPHPSLQRGAG